MVHMGTDRLDRCVGAPEAVAEPEVPNSLTEAFTTTALYVAEG